jgi:hypothetical protein
MGKAEECHTVYLNAWMLCPGLDYTLGEDGVPELDSSLYDRGSPVPIRAGTTLRVFQSSDQDPQSDVPWMRLLSQSRLVHQRVHDGKKWHAVSTDRQWGGPLLRSELREALQSGE